ncbi:MAG: hypothetical protein FWC28_03480, partial [Proteobacteria bacterium]|nr:hypothetical protein [Pseudomonadota bacterium]
PTNSGPHPTPSKWPVHLARAPPGVSAANTPPQASAGTVGFHSAYAMRQPPTRGGKGQQGEGAEEVRKKVRGRSAWKKVRERSVRKKCVEGVRLKYPLGMKRKLLLLLVGGLRIDYRAL